VYSFGPTFSSACPRLRIFQAQNVQKSMTAGDLLQTPLEELTALPHLLCINLEKRPLQKRGRGKAKEMKKGGKRKEGRRERGIGEVAPRLIQGAPEHIHERPKFYFSGLEGYYVSTPVRFVQAYTSFVFSVFYVLYNNCYTQVCSV